MSVGSAAALGATAARRGDPFMGVTAPPSGFVKIVSALGQVSTLIRNGDITRTGSVGGWQQSTRVLRVDADWYNGRPEGSYQIPCMWDVHTGGDSIEDRLDVLYAMGYQPDTDPPELRLYGEVPGGGTRGRWRWKLDDVQLGHHYYQPTPNQTQMRHLELTLMLSTFSPVTRISAVQIKRTRSSPSQRRTRTIVVKTGDTLRTIAVSQLGSSGDYKLIRGWNKQVARTDPDAPLRAGLKLILR